MCPFLDEEDFDDYDDNNNSAVIETIKDNPRKDTFLKDDKKFFIIGGAASVVAFCVVAYFLYSNSKPIDLDDLPVIQADPTPIKVKPQNNTQVSHQDKIVYDNISGEQRKKEEEHIVEQPEEILSINEMDSGGVLSEEEKQKIINAFDELVPEKEYKINYVKTGNSGSIRSTMNRGRGETSEHIIGSGQMKVVEENSLPPLKRIEPLEIAGTGKSKTKKQKSRLADLVNDRKNSAKETATNIEGTEGSSSGNIMVQIASVPTKGGAEVEYRRISNRNKFIKNFGKRIYKVDLGKQKGSTYRIQIGPFKNNAEAQKVISALKNNGCFAYISR